MSELVYVGIDIAKNSFDVAVTGEVQTHNLSNDEAGHVELCQLLLPLAPRLVLLVATSRTWPWPWRQRACACRWSPPGRRATLHAARASWPRPIASMRKPCAISLRCWTHKATSHGLWPTSSGANSPPWWCAAGSW